MGFELGPGVLRRAPRGWLAARAFAVSHRVSPWNYGSEGPPELETSVGLQAVWRVEIPGRAPYELDETERTAPNWLDGGIGIGSGNRWYKPRVRPQFGFMPALGVPCFVNPVDPSELWIDWDASFREHEPAWEQEARLRREIARRDGWYDQLWDRVGNPFAGRLRPGESELVDQRITADPSRARPEPPPADPESTEHRRRMDELSRIHSTGRKTRGLVVAVAATSRSLATVPLVMITFEVEGRHVVFEHVYGPRHLRHYKPGREVDVWVDPSDPDSICPGR